MASIQMQSIREMTQAMTNDGMPQFGEDINPARLRQAVETAQANMPLQEGVEYRSETLGGVEAELSMPVCWQVNPGFRFIPSRTALPRKIRFPPRWTTVIMLTATQ